ncbi:MAG: hypothetical protein WC359_13345 [Dehalococcoidia bacterium]|jgi:hypothetical protein
MNELEREWQTAIDGFEAGIDFKTWLSRRLLTIRSTARALLAAVDYRCDGADRDVRVRDLWGAAYALKRIEQELQEH